MSLDQQNIGSKKYRDPPFGSLARRAVNQARLALLSTVRFFFKDTGYVDVTYPEMLDWQYSETTGILTVDDLSSSGAEEYFEYRGTDGHVVQDTSKSETKQQC